MKTGEGEKVSKICSTCNKSKPKSEFYKNTKASDNLRPNCKECHIKTSTSYYNRNRKEMRMKQAEYSRNNKKSINKRKLETERVRRLDDPLFRLNKSIKCQLRQALTGARLYGNLSRLNIIAGISSLNLVNYLHSTFEENYGMPRAWINLKEVEIDHIIPISTAKTEENVKRLNHYTNLQLLFKEDNQAKGTKITT